MSFIAAVQTNDASHPLNVCLKKVEFTKEGIADWAKTALAVSAQVESDGLWCVRAFTLLCPRLRINAMSPSAVSLTSSWSSSGGDYLDRHSQDPLLRHLPCLRPCQVPTLLSCRGPESVQLSFRFVVHPEALARRSGCHAATV